MGLNFSREDDQFHQVEQELVILFQSQMTSASTQTDQATP
ncbi:hypothetical protein SynPROSU1_01004 [Synechococcus sp. PROS-U-1]|nr:hypothetical protein SynPROSU1_01004 [Synechococcus sp. PROS-U-1]